MERVDGLGHRLPAEQVDVGDSSARCVQLRRSPDGGHQIDVDEREHRAGIV